MSGTTLPLQQNGRNLSQRGENSMHLDYLLALKRSMDKPMKVCHCGSTRVAMTHFEEYRLKDTLEGMIVLTIGASKSDRDLHISMEQAIDLDILHLFKIDEADLV